jgi:hypothetical protein
VGLALVTRIPNYMEAQIAAGALRASGIAAEVFDGGFGGMEAPVIEGLGGYRLMAPAEDVGAARTLLRQLRAAPPLSVEDLPDDAGPWQPEPIRRDRHWRARGMRILAAALLAIPFLLWLVVNALRR